MSIQLYEEKATSLLVKNINIRISQIIQMPVFFNIIIRYEIECVNLFFKSA